MSFSVFGLQFFIEPAPQFGLFEFDTIKHSPRDRELWFMGRHVVVSRR